MTFPIVEAASEKSRQAARLKGIFDSAAIRMAGKKVIKVDDPARLAQVLKREVCANREQEGRDVSAPQLSRGDLNFLAATFKCIKRDDNAFHSADEPEYYVLVNKDKKIDLWSELSFGISMDDPYYKDKWRPDFIELAARLARAWDTNGNGNGRVTYDEYDSEGARPSWLKQCVGKFVRVFKLGDL